MYVLRKMIREVIKVGLPDSCGCHSKYVLSIVIVRIIIGYVAYLRF